MEYREYGSCWTLANSVDLHTSSVNDSRPRPWFHNQVSVPTDCQTLKYTQCGVWRSVTQPNRRVANQIQVHHTTFSFDTSLKHVGLQGPSSGIDALVSPSCRHFTHTCTPPHLGYARACVGYVRRLIALLVRFMMVFEIYPCTIDSREFICREQILAYSMYY